EADGQDIRACQINCADVSEIRIPEASLRDHRLNGVSSFEIGSHNYALRPRPGVGLALDIGTTTVAAALWYLPSGRCLAQGSVANEQRRYGDNVLARIDHAVTLGGTGAPLQSALVEGSLQPLIDSLCAKAQIETSAITEGIAAGNTVMLHSLAGARLSGFAAYPFRPQFIEAQALTSADLGFTTEFPLTLAPNLGPFVGADIALGALAAGMPEQIGPSLLIDFGTNGEILLKTRDGYFATATAAGPAFEGGRLNCGAPAGAGVISSIGFERDAWSIRHTGGQTEARSTGISGGAYVDFIKHAVASGLLNEMGRLDPGHPMVDSLTTEEGTDKRVKIHQQQYISETDVAELIQAKAAIAAGVMTLLEEAGLQAEDLQTLYIAGGFGYHLNSTHAMAIGMIPTVAAEKVRVIGNASLGGASLMLQTNSAATVERLRSQCRIIELNQIDRFEDHFIDCMPLRKI
ncbi:MAG: ASKHA domain-containing protein, partial [Opitutales bacterium]